MRIIANGRYIIADDEATWPTPMDGDQTQDGIEWILRYGTPEQVVKLRFLAASIVNAYRSLVTAPRSLRDPIIRQIRAAHRSAQGKSADV